MIGIPPTSSTKGYVLTATGSDRGAEWSEILPTCNTEGYLLTAVNDDDDIILG
jgi:hypothetical protein